MIWPGLKRRQNFFFNLKKDKSRISTCFSFFLLSVLMINFVVALTTTSRGPFPTYWRGFKEETLKSHGTWECVDWGTFSCFFLSTGKTGRHFFGYSARENRKKRLVFSHLCAQQVHTQNESLLCIFRVVLIFRILEKGTFSHRFKKKEKENCISFLLF